MKSTLGPCVCCLTLMLMLSCGESDNGGGRMFGGRRITMEAYWNDSGKLVFERSSSRPAIGAISIWKTDTILWNVLNGYQPFTAVEYGVVPTYLGGAQRPTQTIPANGTAPPELSAGDVVSIDLAFRMDVFPVASMGSEEWRITIPPKGQRSQGTRLRSF